MNTLKSICVYCASSNAVDPNYIQLASDLGVYLGQEKRTLVYGGGHCGLMGAVADAALGHGADVIGVIPQYLKDKEVAHTGLTKLHVTETMQQRQQKMADLSDAFVMLPGGLGTLAEFFEVVTWKQLGLHDKPIIVLNAYGYWDLLFEMLEKSAQEKFLYQSSSSLYSLCDDLEAVKKCL